MRAQMTTMQVMRKKLRAERQVRMASEKWLRAEFKSRVCTFMQNVHLVTIQPCLCFCVSVKPTVIVHLPLVNSPAAPVQL
jgi:hypothetical protein